MIKRLFLGISPSPTQANLLARNQLLVNTDGHVIPRENFHVTICFLGQVDGRQQTQLVDALDQLNRQGKLKRFSVDLETVVWWQKAKVICQAGKAQDLALLELHQRCQGLSSELNLHQSEHRFTPHISLFRKARKYTPVQITPLKITAQDLCLYQSVSSDNGVSYPVVHSWRLS